MSIFDTGADSYLPENQLKIVSGQGELKETGLGAVRESNEGRGRFDLLPYEAMEALAKWYEAGSKKYDERNWENGVSVKDCINRMIRHAIKAGNGWTDEDHLSAVMWNAAAAITMIQRRPDCNDHRWIVHESDPNENINQTEELIMKNINDDIVKKQMDNILKKLDIYSNNLSEDAIRGEQVQELLMHGYSAQQVRDYFMNKK